MGVETSAQGGGVALRHRRFLLVASGWLLLGLFVDGWAHQNLPSVRETFFTVWHALFYSGFAASLLAHLTAARAFGGVAHVLRSRQPAGLAGGLVGAGSFLLGGVVDAFWHEAFGIEIQIDALVSPPHLLITTGVLLMVTTVYRLHWAGGEASPSMRQFFPALVSMVLGTSLVAFMLMYLSPVIGPDAGSSAAQRLEAFSGLDHGFARYMSWRSGLASMFAWTLVLFGPLMLSMRRSRLPSGTATFHITAVTALMVSIYSFTTFAFVVAAFVSGVAVDGLYQRWGPDETRWLRARFFGGAAPVITWAVYMLTLAVTDGIGWPPALWLGGIFWSGMVGLGLSMVAFPPPFKGHRPV